MITKITLWSSQSFGLDPRRCSANCGQYRWYWETLVVGIHAECMILIDSPPPSPPQSPPNHLHNLQIQPWSLNPLEVYFKKKLFQLVLKLIAKKKIKHQWFSNMILCRRIIDNISNHTVTSKHHAIPETTEKISSANSHTTNRIHN